MERTKQLAGLAALLLLAGVAGAGQQFGGVRFGGGTQVAGGVCVALPASAGVAVIGTSTTATYGVLSGSGVGALAFDGATMESIQFTLRLPDSYDSSQSLVIEVEVAAAGTSQDQQWQVQIGTLAGTDLDTAIASILDTAQEQSVTTSATQMITSTVTWTLATGDMDSAAAGDWIVLQLQRDAAPSTGDASTVDGYVVGVVVHQ